MTRLMVLSFAMLVSFVAAACSSTSGGTPGAASLQDLSKIEHFQALFAQDLGKPRLVLLVSPT
jgi:hypothetical protein